MKTIIIILFVSLLFCNKTAYSQQPTMVKDINPGTTTSFFEPSFTAIGSTLYFAANDGTNGYELWKSDGTNAGTVMVKDIYPGYVNGIAFGSEPRNLTNVNGTLFFTANNGTNSRELWKSDGTEAGTIMVKDITTGFSNIQELTDVNGILFFSANDVNGIELWKSDGTEAGTAMVKDIYSGVSAGFANSSFPVSLTNINGTLFFEAKNNADSFAKLWKSDGTTLGTVLVLGYPETTSTMLDVGKLYNMNNTLYLTIYDNFNGTELWKSNGTTAGTSMIKDIFPGYNIQVDVAYSSVPNNLTYINGIIFFSAADTEIDSINKNFELWKTDGTNAGTVKVKEIRNGTYNYGSYPTSLVNGNGTLYFSANDGINGIEIWKSDGTETGTTIVKDLYSGIGNSEPREFININGTTYFVANDGIIGQELFKTDGTVSGTIGYNIRFLSESSSPEYLTNVNGKLFFTANNGGQNGRELWVLDTNSLSVKNNEITESKITIFPNPVNNILTIQIPEKTSMGNITITDLTGKKVLEQNNNATSVNVENLQNGIYLFQIVSEGKTATSKFIKQ